MIQLRKAQERGHFDFGWLNTYHSFSFGEYHDPEHMGFRTLRVINEDRIQPAQGFGTHPHRDMEIITVILEGALEHKDSMGNSSVIRPGEVQRMTAGTGVTHSEFNPSESEPTHLYQIWILPAERDLAPSYEQKAFGAEQKQGQLCLLASPDGRDGSVTIHQDTNVYTSVLNAAQSLRFAIPPEHHVWLQVARGALTCNGQALRAGDGLAASGESALQLTATDATEFLLFDLA